MSINFNNFSILRKIIFTMKIFLKVKLSLVYFLEMKILLINSIYFNYYTHILYI